MNNIRERRAWPQRAIRLAAAVSSGLITLALVSTPAHADPPWRGRPPAAGAQPSRGAPSPAPQPRGPAAGPGPGRGMPFAQSPAPQPRPMVAPTPAPVPNRTFRGTPPMQPAPQPVGRPLPPGHGGTPPGQQWGHRHHDRGGVAVVPVPAPVVMVPPPHVHVVAPPPPVVGVGIQVGVAAPPPVYVAPAPQPVYVEPRHHHHHDRGGPVSISGTVRTAYGQPVAGVMMVLAGTSEGRVVTDSAGRYAFYGLRPGSYAVRPNGPCGFGPDVVNLNNLDRGVVQDFNANCR